MNRKIIPLFAAAALFLAGCGAEESKTASVQSVAMICDLTTLTQSRQFAGIVSTGKEENVARDSSRNVAKVNVKAGDIVKEGDVLFTYDSEQAKNSLEKAELDLEQQQNGLESTKTELEQLKTNQAKASQSEQLDYILKIRETETDIREREYNLTLKEREIQKLRDSLSDLDVKAPFGGRIEKAGTATNAESSDLEGDLGTYAGGEESDASAFIKIVEMDNYRIKGTINEQNIRDLTVGLDMVIYSRVDDTKTWTGVVTEINTGQNEKNAEEEMYGGGGGDEMTQSSKYPFYVRIDALDGLMIGQHVYMRAGTAQEEEEIRLDASFINDADTAPWIWAEDANGLLEKRSVTVGEYEAGDNTYLVEDGITADDYIAPSGSDLEVGMVCIENNNSAFEASDEAGGDADAAAEDEEFTEEELGDEEFKEEDFGDEEYFEEDFGDEGFDEEVYEDEEYMEEDMGGGAGMGTAPPSAFGGAVG